MVKLTASEAQFGGLTFIKKSEDEMDITVIVNDDDQTRKLKFAGRRVESK